MMWIRNTNWQHPLPFLALMLAATTLAVHASRARAGGEVGFVEPFALAPDRDVPLKTLVPGTEDYYYYHCLHFQNLEQYDRVEQLLVPWIERYKLTPRVMEIQNRQALLQYERSPERSLTYLRDQLGLGFGHQRETVDPGAAFPSALDNRAIGRDELRTRAFQLHTNLDGFEDSALIWLATTQLSQLEDAQRRELLSRLTRPDWQGLVDVLASELKQTDALPFGGLSIHAQLTLEQLDELARRLPPLTNETAYVNTYLTKLAPPADTDWAADLAAYKAYLETLWTFVAKLSDAHNTLKAHVLYHRLALDIRLGEYDQQRLLTYLKLPRSVTYINAKYLQLPNNRRVIADLSADFQSQTRLPSVQNDETVVRTYLAHFLVDAENYRPFEPYIADSYLKPLFAETKIVNGLGSAEQWSNLISPEAYQQLRDRVDIDFDPTNPQQFGAAQEVALDVFVKNVPTLIVKVYRINSLNYYRDHAQHVPTDLNLDGLVANSETSVTYSETPFRRIRRHLALPDLKVPGIYVVDLIGNGTSSRVLIHKGQLTHTVRTSAAGQAITVLDEQRKPLKDARVWMGGQIYAAQESGEILLPFSATPGNQPIILLHGELASLSTYVHQQESYQLRAAVHVERESLRARRVAPLLIRPQLCLSGTPISLKALEAVTLTITTTDADQISSTDTVEDIKLSDGSDLTYELRVPPRLSQLQVTLSGRIAPLTGQTPITVTDTKRFDVNKIDTTDKIEALQLGRTPDAYLLEVFGRSGEPRSGQLVEIKLKHRDFRDAYPVTLRSDGDGKISLGALRDITHVTAQLAGGPELTWPLAALTSQVTTERYAAVGHVIQIPYHGTAQEPDADHFSLLELRNGTYVQNRLAHVRLEPGRIVVRDLPAGDYELQLKEYQTLVSIRVTAGPIEGGYVIGKSRALESSVREPVAITSATLKDKHLSVQLANATPLTRVHVYGVAFLPLTTPYQELNNVLHPMPAGITRPILPSYYLQGRQLGDEFRYVLDRRYAKKFPGNMLKRPELLLNPWDVRDTQTSKESLERDAEFDRMDAPAAPAAEAPRPEGESHSVDADFANFDFLPDASLVLVNLKTNAEGQLEIDLEELNELRGLYIVSADDTNTDQMFIAMPDTKRRRLDLRLLQSLDAKQDVSLQKQVSLHDANQSLEVANLGSGRFKLIDSLPAVYEIYSTLLPNSALTEFRFLTKWPTYTDAQKREYYSKYSCHELNFFLAHKDPDFFRQVIQPYLANKLHKTFMDNYLLEASLTEYLSPWNYEQLNAAERILLAKRVDKELAQTLLLLQNEWQILVTDQDRLDQLFDTSMLGDALDGEVERVAGDDKSTMAGLGGASIRGLAPQLANGAVPPVAAANEARFALEEGKAEGAVAEQSLGQLDAADATGGRRMKYRRDRQSLGKDVYFKDEDVEGRKMLAARLLFQAVDQTKEWAENNYYRLPIEQQNAALITTNDFWIDWASQGAGEAFLSKHFAQPTHNFTEAMLALAILDLPWTAPDHQVEVVDQTIKIRTAGRVIALSEQIEPVTRPAQTPPILVSQNFFRQGERWRMVNGEKIDLFVQDEFLKSTVYGALVVVTNATSSRQKVDVLRQLPTGAVPVSGGKVTQTSRVLLEPYQTTTIEYFFYFPATGDYDQYPVHVSRGNELVSAVAPAKFHVVEQLSHVDRQSWDYVSQHGTDQEVADYLRTQNLQPIALSRIAFRMADAKVFAELIGILRQRHSFDATLWSYGLKHNDRQAAGEYLEHRPDFLGRCGDQLTCSLLTINPVERQSYQHLEYHPLVNARTHQIGKQRQIFNDRFYAQYQAWLKLLTYTRKLGASDRLVTVYYLLLQDRIDDAVAQFSQIDPKSLSSRLQYDYCQAYLAMSQGDTAKARALSLQYANYPVDRWRDAFAVVNQHLDEIEAKDGTHPDTHERDQIQDRLAATQPIVDLEINDKSLLIHHRNVTNVKINYYLMDIELLFSRNPFVQQHEGQFAYIAANASETLQVTEAESTDSHALPPALHNKNVLIELESAGQRVAKPYYSNAMKVQVIDSYGQIRVTLPGSNTPLSTAYCKVYAKMKDGNTVFYKDGYTDLRGRFDYASLSTNQLDSVEQFAILVMSDEHGAVVREAKPPQR